MENFNDELDLMQKFDELKVLHTFEDIADLYSDCDKMKFIKTQLDKHEINYDYDLLMIKCGKIWLGFDNYKSVILDDKPLTDDFKINNPEYKANSFRFIASVEDNKIIRYSIWNEVESENICVSKITIIDKKPKRDDMILTEREFSKFISKISKTIKH